MHSAWTSDLIEDQNQHQRVDGYTRCSTNNVNGMNDADNANNGNKMSSFRALTPATAMAGYSSAFQSGKIDSSSTPGNTNTTNHMDSMTTAKNDKIVNYNPTAATAPMTAYPSAAFQSGKVDVPSMNGYTASTNRTNRGNIVDTGADGTKVNYHASTAAGPMPTYPNTFQSSAIDSRSTRNTNTTTNASNMNTTRNGNKSNYHSSTATQSLLANPKVTFQSDDIESRYTPGNKINNMNNMKTMDATNNVQTGNYDQPLAAPAIAGYLSGFHPGEVDLNSTPGYTNNTNNTHRVNTMGTTKNGKKSNSHGSTASPLTPAYPSAFNPGEIDVDSTPDYTNTTNNMNRMGTANAAKNGNKSTYHASTAAPPIPAYQSAFHSGEIDSSPIPGYNNQAYNVNRMSTLDTAKNVNNGSYHSSAAAPPTAPYPAAFHPDEIDSDSTRTLTMNSVNDVNDTSNVDNAMSARKGNYTSPTEDPTAVEYPRPFQSGKIDPTSTRRTMNPVSNTNSVRNMSNANTSKNIKKGYYHPSTAAPATPAQRSAFRPSDGRSSSNNTISVDMINNVNKGKKGAMAGSAYSCAPQSIEIESSTNNTNSMNGFNGMNTVNRGRKGIYSQLAAEPAIEAYGSEFPSGEIGPSSPYIAAAWEEHIDETTNRKYFYNSITRRSTWGQPSGMVKRPPPPPPSPPPISRIVKKREQDHWFKITDKRGGRLWYNEITKRSQIARPDCLRKYK